MVGGIFNAYRKARIIYCPNPTNTIFLEKEGKTEKKESPVLPGFSLL
jgi:hypothetical protein